jgi:hypothetical protein
LADHPAFIERVKLYPDIHDFGFPEEIIDMPENFFILSQMALEPFLKASLGSAYIKIASRTETGFR